MCTQLILKSATMTCSKASETKKKTHQIENLMQGQEDFLKIINCFQTDQ